MNANLANEFDDYEPAYLQYLAESVEDERNHAAVLHWVKRFCSIDGETVLDVGCGSGKFVRFLRRANLEAVGLEGASPLYSRFLSKEPFFVHQTIEDYAATTAAEQFGSIFACDVIEHLERPDLFLRDAAKLLRPRWITLREHTRRRKPSRSSERSRLALLQPVSSFVSLQNDDCRDGGQAGPSRSRLCSPLSAEVSWIRLAIPFELCAGRGAHLGS